MTDRLEIGERWFQLMEWFEARNGRAQIRVSDLAHELGWPDRAVTRHLARMERLGVVAVMRTSRDWGTGRSPNTYTLLMTSAEWEERGQKIARDWRRKDRRERREAERRKPKDNQVAIAIPALRPLSKANRKLEEEIQADVETRIEAAGAAESAGDLDVDAWLAGS